MFEKEARKWVKEHTKIDYQASYGEFPIEPSAKKSFKAGAEFGYNKANEWHYVKEGDLPKEDLRPRTLGYYLTASKHKSYKGFVFEVAYFTGVIFTKGGDILDNVIAWKEIVLPELEESE